MCLRKSMCGFARDTCISTKSTIYYKKNPAITALLTKIPRSCILETPKASGNWNVKGKNTMTDRTIIGRNIAALRKEAGLTQTELADKLHVSHQAVSQWERGETLPDILTLPALAEIFSTGVGRLLGSEAVKENEPAAIEDVNVDVQVDVQVQLESDPVENLPPVVSEKQITHEVPVDKQGDYTIVIMRGDVVVEKFPFSDDGTQLIVNLQGSCGSLAVSAGQAHICGDVIGNASIACGGTIEGGVGGDVSISGGANIGGDIGGKCGISGGANISGGIGGEATISGGVNLSGSIGGSASISGGCNLGGDVNGNLTISGESTIAGDISGDVTTDSELTIEGDVGGNVTVIEGSNVAVTINGDVNGDVDCGELEVNGDMNGDVDCGNCTVSGDVNGDVDAGNTTIGGSVEGDVDCGSLHVEGDIDGDVDCSDCTIYGDANGDIEATTVTVNGDAAGDIEAEQVRIHGDAPGYEKDEDED